jgi:predicted SAM-dependent methyltransferase
MKRRLHWGCGPNTPYGWVNSDILAFPGVDVVADIREGLPFEDGAFDLIVTIHTLPELAFREMDRALAELFRVLAPGGTLRLSLPDLDKAIQAYRANDIDYFFLIPDDQARTLSGKMIAQLLWYGQSRMMFTWESIQELLIRNGFTDIQRCGFRQTRSALQGITDLDDRELESLFVEARRSG